MLISPQLKDQSSGEVIYRSILWHFSLDNFQNTKLHKEQIIRLQITWSAITWTPRSVFYGKHFPQWMQSREFEGLNRFKGEKVSNRTTAVTFGSHRVTSALNKPEILKLAVEIPQIDVCKWGILSSCELSDHYSQRSFVHNHHNHGRLWPNKWRW